MHDNANKYILLLVMRNWYLTQLVAAEWIKFELVLNQDLKQFSFLKRRFKMHQSKRDQRSLVNGAELMN